MTSSSGVWAVGGSRSLSQAGQAVAQYVTREMLASGARLAVGCCMGADAAALVANTSPTWRGKYELPLAVVLELASALGPTEDFDGFITELCDIADSGGFADYAD